MKNVFCHFELSTDDTGKAKEFYGALFDWKFNDMDMHGSVYTGIDTGEQPGGGPDLPPLLNNKLPLQCDQPQDNGGPVGW